VRKLLFLFCLLAIISCNKKEEPPAKTPELISYYDKYSEAYPALNITNDAPTCNYVYKNLAAYSYSSPRVNPNNPYEFCFLRIRNQDQNEADCDLFVYNFVTNTVKPISNHVRYAADWSSDNWIIFTKVSSGSQIWKIKSNGDSLTQLIAENSPIKPVWSKDGKHFIFYCTVCGVTKVATANGQIIKTLAQKMHSWGWKSANDLLYYSNDTIMPELFSYNIKNDSTSKLGTGAPEQNSWTFDVKTNTFLHAGVVLSTSKLGESNASTVKNFKRLTENSADDYNLFPNYSNNRIISQRNISFKMLNESCSYELRSEISVMNADGTNERKVLIPNY